MTQDSNKSADEITDVAKDSISEIALDDLKPNADVNGGSTQKIPDVTLKRGIIG